MPRIAPTLVDFVARRRRRVPEDGPRPSSASSTARTGCASTAPAPASRCCVDKIGIDELREHGRGGARGRLGRRARLLDRRPRLPPRRGGRRARRAATPTARPTATARSSSASAPPTSCRSARRASRRPGQGHARRPHAGAVPRPRGRSCATTRGGYARTTVQQNLVLRWVRDEAVYDVWQRARRARPRRRRRGRDHRRRLAAPAPTRCKLGITSSMGLNARGPGAASRRWRSRTR